MTDWADKIAEQVYEMNEPCCDCRYPEMVAGIAVALRAVRAACADIADDWGPGINESWENADTHIADAIRKADLSPTLAKPIS